VEECAPRLDARRRQEAALLRAIISSTHVKTHLCHRVRHQLSIHGIRGGIRRVCRQARQGECNCKKKNHWHLQSRTTATAGAIDCESKEPVFNEEKVYGSCHEGSVPVVHQGGTTWHAHLWRRIQPQRGLGSAMADGTTIARSRAAIRSTRSSCSANAPDTRAGLTTAAVSTLQLARACMATRCERAGLLQRQCLRGRRHVGTGGAGHRREPPVEHRGRGGSGMRTANSAGENANNTGAAREQHRPGDSEDVGVQAGTQTRPSGELTVVHVDRRAAR
jgi:hypothetical protein